MPVATHAQIVSAVLEIAKTKNGKIGQVTRVEIKQKLALEVPPLTLHPRGGTALLDAMGKLITDTATELNALADDVKPGVVVVAIMTDGLENASAEWRRPDVKSLVEQQTSAGWEFLYMGADQDAVEVGKGLGVKAEQAVTYARGRSREAMMATSANVRGYRSAKMADPAAAMPAFTDAQRAELAQE